MFDLQPILTEFQKLAKYIDDFIRDAHDPKYILALGGQQQAAKDPEFKELVDQTYFSYKCPVNLTQARDSKTPHAFECKLKRQYRKILEELRDVRETFTQMHQRFRASIDQLEYHDYPEKGDARKLRSTRMHEHLNNYYVYQKLPMHEKKQIIQTLLILQHVAQHPKYMVALHNTLFRMKRFDLLGLVFGWTAFTNRKTINEMKTNIEILRKNQALTQQQIQELAHTLNMSITILNEHTESLIDLNFKMLALNKTMRTLITGFSGLRVAMSTITDLRNGVSQAKTGVLAMENNVEQVEENLRVMATRKANPLILPPEKLRNLLVKIKDQMRENPRLQLPEDPDRNIWAYYQFVTVSPIIMEKCLMVVVTIPLLDKSNEVELYKAYSLAALHPVLKVEFQYQLENPYIGIANHGLFTLLPDPQEIELCKATSGYYCYFRQALYPTEGNQWCIYALFIDNKTAIEEYCTIKMEPRYQNRAINLDGFWWAVSVFKTEHIHVRCLTESHAITIEPPLEIVNIPNGCEGFSASVYIPARSELTMDVDATNFTTFFQTYKHTYTRMDSYHVWYYLEVTTVDDLTEKEKREIAEKFTTIPPMNMKLFKKNYQKLKEYSFSLSSKTILVIMIVITTLTLIAIVVVICIYIKNRKVSRKMISRVGETLNTSVFIRKPQELPPRIPNRLAVEMSPPRRAVMPSTSADETHGGQTPLLSASRHEQMQARDYLQIVPEEMETQFVVENEEKPRTVLETGSEWKRKRKKPITQTMIHKATRRLMREGYVVKS